MSNSCIQSNGGITVPRKYVTWFKFLQISRSANWKEGGWNSKTFWEVYGMKALERGGSAFIANWTENSLVPDSLPEPRTGDFYLPRELAEMSMERKNVLMKYPSMKPYELPEVALNVRLFELYSKTGSNFYDCGRLIGYETPLAEHRDDQLRVDLFAIRDEGTERFVSLIELKKGESDDSPLMAVVEAICYGLQLIRCKESLLKDKKLADIIKEEHLRHVRLVVAAPSIYWAIWTGPPDSPREEKLTALRKLVGIVNHVTTGDRWKTQISIDFHEITNPEPNTFRSSPVATKP